MSIPFIKDLLIAGFKCLGLLFRETAGGLCGPIDRILDIQKAVDHAIGPLLLVLLVHEDQLPKMVSVALPMEAWVVEVGFPKVVNGPSYEVG